MRYCTHCGEPIENDDAVVCVKCGCTIDPQVNKPVRSTSSSSGLSTAAKVLMILGCVSSAIFYLIPLCWTIPMTIHYFNARKENRPVSMGFKVCTLLFVNAIAGILMLCDPNS